MKPRLIKAFSMHLTEVMKNTSSSNNCWNVLSVHIIPFHQPPPSSFQPSKHIFCNYSGPTYSIVVCPMLGSNCSTLGEWLHQPSFKRVGRITNYKQRYIYPILRVIALLDGSNSPPDSLVYKAEWAKTRASCTLLGHPTYTSKKR